VSASFGKPRGPAGAPGAMGNPGAWVTTASFVQPAVAGTANARWDTAFLTPEVGMRLAGASGVYDVTANVGGGFFQLTCLEIRGVAQGANVPANSVFGQAGAS
jgi:hypothetical protein